jgi:hypothetical protein
LGAASVAEAGNGSSNRSSFLASASGGRFSRPWGASAQETRIAEQKRSRELYGDALEDVDFLRRCGWAINLSSDGRVQFGNQLLTLGELREKAERERRLRQPTPIGAMRVQALASSADAEGVRCVI